MFAVIDYAKKILQNKQFKSLIKESFSGSSFIFESSDNLFLENFVFSFAKFLLCQSEKRPCEECVSCKKVNLGVHPDITVYPKSRSNILVEDVKDLIDTSLLSPIETDKKVFIFKNFSSANVQSQNKLLKILEEPPKNVFILLCVTNISKILLTIQSRCQKIRLEKLSNAELESFLDFSQVSNYDKNKIICSSCGSLETAVNYLKNPQFFNVFDNCLSVLKNMKSTTELLKYSSLFANSKESFELALRIFENLYRDLLLIRLGKERMVVNTFVLKDLMNLSEEYDCDAIDKIIRKIYVVNKKLEFNCNYILNCDNLFLYILEVKFLCKK